MSKVLVFDTLAESKIGLEDHCLKNKSVAGMIVRDLEAKARVYKSSAVYTKLHKTDLEQLTEAEIKALMPDAAAGKSFFSFLKLYSVENLYSFDTAVFELSEIERNSGHYDSLSSLAKEAQKYLLESQKIAFGAGFRPVFYTVLEPYRITEDDCEKLKQLPGYRSLSPIDQGDIDHFLENYVERGLTKKEIEEFERSYFKTLPN
ncbi:MAG: hypothetical protein AABX05_04965 [Nanoarchaeota archaeon]